MYIYIYKYVLIYEKNELNTSVGGWESWICSMDSQPSGHRHFVRKIPSRCGYVLRSLEPRYSKAGYFIESGTCYEDFMGFTVPMKTGRFI